LISLVVKWLVSDDKNPKHMTVVNRALNSHHH
jgi:hypothetical protein